MDHLSVYGEADKPPPSPPKESEPVEEPRNDTSVSPDLPQGGITGPSTSVPANPARSIPSTLDPSPQASQPVPEELKESSSLCPLPPPKEEPYDSYQRTGRKRIDFVKKTARPAVAALPQNLTLLPETGQPLPAPFPTYEGPVGSPVGPRFAAPSSGLQVPLSGHFYSPVPAA